MMEGLPLLVLTAFGVSMILTRTFRKLSFSEMLDLPDNGRKIHVAPVPRSGGAAICLSYLAVLAVWSCSVRRPEEMQVLELLSSLLPGAILVFCVGLLDDLIGLTPGQKLAGETVAALLVHASGMSVVGDASVWWSGPATVFWLLLTTNGFNLIDGLDGLAAGIALVGVAVVATAAILQGNLALALISAPLIGALLGFLPYNAYPASVFLGDSGSLFLGFMSGCAILIWSGSATSIIGSLAPVLVLTLPIVEVALSFTRRLVEGQPVFQADREHIHHRLLTLGLGTARSVALLEAFAAAAGVLALVTLYVSARGGLFLLVMYFSVTVAGLGYLYPTSSTAWLRRPGRAVED